MDVGPVLAQYGLAGLVIFALSTVVVYQNRQYAKLQDKYDQKQEERLADARETRDRLVEPMNEQAKLSEKIYDLLLNGSQRRR